MQPDSADEVTALYRLAAAQMELHDALVQLRATCERTAAALRGAASSGAGAEPGDEVGAQPGDEIGAQPQDEAGDRPGVGPVEHPDLVELDAMLTEVYG